MSITWNGAFQVLILRRAAHPDYQADGSVSDQRL